jgi:hypothetical protein
MKFPDIEFRLFFEQLAEGGPLKSNLSNLFFYLDRPLTRDEAKAKIRELLAQL